MNDSFGREGRVPLSATLPTPQLDVADKTGKFWRALAPVSQSGSRPRTQRKLSAPLEVSVGPRYGRVLATGRQRPVRRAGRTATFAADPTSQDRRLRMRCDVRNLLSSNKCLTTGSL